MEHDMSEGQEAAPTVLDVETHVALERYKATWAYYTRTTEIAAQLLDWYFKLAAFPSLIAFVGAVRDEFLPSAVIGSLLIAVYVAGYCLVVAYGKMCRNSYTYSGLTFAIEDKLLEKHPWGRETGSVNDWRGELGALTGETSWGTTSLWRLLSVAVINSAIGSLGAHFLGADDAIALVAALVSVGLHVLVFRAAHGPFCRRTATRPDGDSG